jgi:uncharacterized protein YutD
VILLQIYSQEFARKHLPKKFRQIHKIPKVRFNYDTESWVSDSFELPNYDNSIKDNYVILTPIDLLTKDETWINRSELLKNFNEIVDAVPNSVLRASLNNYFDKRLREIVTDEDKKATKKEKTQAINDTILEYPEIIDYFVKDKEENGDEANSSSSLKVVESKLLYLKHFSQLAYRLLTTTEF